jgi:putative transposase
LSTANPSHHPCDKDKAIPNYRRNFLLGGSYFFTANLADRRLGLLTEHIALLRARFVRCAHDTLL